MQCGTDLTYCNFTLGFIFNWDMSVTLCEAHFWYFSVVLALQVFVSGGYIAVGNYHAETRHGWTWGEESVF